MIENIEPFLLKPDEVRAIIQENINRYTKEDLKKIPWGERVSIRKNTSNITTSRYDKYRRVYLPDEINPIALTEYLQTEKKYETEKELVLAAVCRAMVGHINELYAAACGRKSLSWARNCVFSVNLSKKQWMSIEDEYRRKIDSRNGYKMIRAKRMAKREETVKEG
ncbi:MAG: hypothetical protein E7268_04400 [Lachnospiraceae bacterium]|nr:hypothetical protein [Lachnospiraceae bacterium]